MTQTWFTENEPLKQFACSLKNRIVLLTLGAVLLTAILFAGGFYLRITQLSRDAAVMELAGDTRLLAQRFKTVFSQMKHDSQVLAGTPQVSGIILAHQQGPGNLGSLSPYDTWGPQLGSIFQSVMTTRPYYTQLRLIGVDGRELARVNRMEHGLETVPQRELQDKSQEPYVKAGMGLFPGQVYFSEVTYNRENGKIEDAHVPTIRAIMPIFSNAGTRLGLLVINADYAELLRNEFETIPPTQHIIAFNNYGDYIERRVNEPVKPFEMHGHYQRSPPKILSLAQGVQGPEELLEDDSQIAYLVRFRVDSGSPQNFLSIIVQMPKAAFMAPVQQAFKMSMYFGTHLLLAILLASFFLANNFMRPLRKMTQAIEHSTGHSVPQDLPTGRQDEIGALARAFKARAYALLDSEAQARAILDNMFDGLLTLDQHGIITNCNPSCERIFGFRVNELLGQNVQRLIPDFAQIGEDLHQTLLDHLGKTQKITARHKCGKTVVIEFSVSLVVQGRRNIYSCILRDVSEQQHMRDALQAAEERWSLALNAAQIGVFDVDLTARKSVVSDIWREMLGFPPDVEIDAQQEWEQRIHPEDRELVRAADAACFAGETTSSVKEHRMRHYNGHWIWLRSVGRIAEWGEDGEPLRFIGVQMDITELKVTEAKLKASEERLRMAIDNAPIAMALVDLDGHWLKVNDALCGLLGYAEDDLLTLSFKDVTAEISVDSNMLQMKRLLQGEIDTCAEEKCYQRKDGSPVWCRVNMSVARDADGKPAYFIKQILDISKQRETERLQSEFISTVNHELRTPLTAIRGSLAMLEAKLHDRLSINEMRLLSNSHESCQRLSRLVNDILDVQQISQGRVEYNFKTVDVCALVEDVVESQQAMAERFGVRIETALPEVELPLWIDGDRFTQALINVLANALKFSERGEKIVLAVTQPTSNSIRVAVQDFGPGIPADFRARIFTKFAQADGSSKRKAEGSGLGLSITKSLVEAMGGRIDFESEEGQGTTFFFEFPMSKFERKSA